MKTLLLLFFIVVFGYLFLVRRQGTSAFDELKKGRFGAFNITKSFKFADSYIAIDVTAKKLALVNIGIPSFDNKGFIVRYDDMTVVFSISEISRISVTLDKAVLMVRFFFNSQVPIWNIDKALSFACYGGVKQFFEEYLTDTEIDYQQFNSEGKLEPWP